MLQMYKDFVEIAFPYDRYVDKFTKNLSDLHLIVILIVYNQKK